MSAHVPRRGLRPGERLGRPVSFTTELYPAPWAVAYEPYSEADRLDMARRYVEEWDADRDRAGLGVGPPPPVEQVLDESIPEGLWTLRDATGLLMARSESLTNVAAALYAGVVSLPDEPVNDAGETVRDWLETRLRCLPGPLGLAAYGLPESTWAGGFEAFGQKLYEAFRQWRVRNRPGR